MWLLQVVAKVKASMHARTPSCVEGTPSFLEGTVNRSPMRCHKLPSHFTFWVLFATRTTNTLELSGLVLPSRHCPPPPHLTAESRPQGLSPLRGPISCREAPTPTPGLRWPCCSSNFSHWWGKQYSSYRLCKLPLIVFKVYCTLCKTILFSEASILCN